MFSQKSISSDYFYTIHVEELVIYMLVDVQNVSLWCADLENDMPLTSSSYIWIWPLFSYSNDVASVAVR
jgi:hypothetical protein